MALPLPVMNTWGGKRAGAGRKPSRSQPGATHQKRPEFSPHHPLHVTLKVLPGIENLRTRRCYRVIEGAFLKGCKKDSFRLIHFSVMKNHIHIIAEASDAQALSRGMKGLAIRIARGLNRVLSLKGKVFAYRYHARILRTPTEVNHCLRYVLNNYRRHNPGWRFDKGWIDPCSSGRFFSGWSGRTFPLARKGPWPVAPAEGWLLKTGWKHLGLIDINKRPGPAGPPSP
jgi:REP element-mobilizing transposase RayT